MVSIAAPGLTKIGFRRDVRLFLAALVGFLVFLILLLLILLQNFLLSSEQLMQRQRQILADAGKAALDAIGNEAGDSEVAALITTLRTRYGALAIEVTRPNGRRLLSGSVGAEEETARLERPSSAGPMRLWFDASPNIEMRRTFGWTAAITIAATVAGTILLLLYLPRIVRPIEEMLDHAKELGEQHSDVEESRYLIETFKSSIARLKSQEGELKRLHDREKSRADDLERMTATLTRSLGSGFIALDSSGNVIDANRAAREILRITPARALAGAHISEALGPSAFAECLRSAFELESSLARREIEARFGDEVLTIGLTTVPLRNEEGGFLGMLALFTDLTPIRSLEARVRDLQTLADLGEISAGIAHEFRNSLSTILGYLKLARRESLPDDALMRVRKAELEGSLLSAAVESLLAFARPMNLERRPLDLRQIVEGIVERLPSSDRVEVRVEGDAAAIEGDEALLGRAFENLIRNAIESVEQKGGDGSVTIRVSDQPVPAVVISDSGIGLDSSNAARLFLPFQSEKASGMGLGLALAKKIVLLHGGAIRLTGEKGVGATATVELPNMPSGV
ncbi:MAG TPA: ATP-binding protein [Thermoanaerobaculia bacterium]|nr:ATP-binding protein [Thermoanaerobaculia bacterium]